MAINPPGSRPHAAAVADYESDAQELLNALHSGDEAVLMRFKWEHPAYKGRPLKDVDPTVHGLDDGRTVVAQEHSFNTWDELARFTQAVASDPAVARFEAAADAVVGGDLGALTALLQADPGLVHARSLRRHHATLLHYLGANGVEQGRQRTPANAVAMAKALLDAGADPDALADLYDSPCTTMSMVISSSHPASAGLQSQLAETLLDYGAALVDPGAKPTPLVNQALAFGYLDTARVLADRGAPVDLVAAAGLGRLENVKRDLPAKVGNYMDAAGSDVDTAGSHIDGRTRQAALAVAVQHGQVAIVEHLLAAGVDPSRYNPEGHHAHSTPLHQAVWSNQLDVVRVLVKAGARLDMRDTIYDGTPLDWAEYGKRDEIAKYLRTVSG